VKAPRVTGGPVPFGFDLVDGALVANEHEQRILVEARALRAEGLSLRAIAAELAQAGYVARSQWFFRVETR
jgi:hypothetical protein